MLPFTYNHSPLDSLLTDQCLTKMAKLWQAFGTVDRGSQDDANPMLLSDPGFARGNSYGDTATAQIAVEMYGSVPHHGVLLVATADPATWFVSSNKYRRSASSLSKLFPLPSHLYLSCNYSPVFLQAQSIKMAVIEKDNLGDTKHEYVEDLEKTNTTWDDRPTLDPELDKRITRKFDRHGKHLLLAKHLI